VNAIRKRIRAFADLLLHEHTAPGRVAAAIFVGAVVGCTPIFGLHIVACIALAYLFRLNKIIVYGAANLSIPPMVPILGFTSVQLGERILHGRWLALHRADFALKNVKTLARTFFVDWTVGGIVLGATVGLVAGGITWAIMSARNARKLRTADAIGAAIDVARRRYDGLHPRFKWYARMKYVMDPCYRAIAALVPPGAYTVDLGSGLGMLPVLLGVLGDGRRALGVEWDRSKVDCGLRAARDLPDVQIVEGDARAADLPACDVITLVDMLHYWDDEAQRALLSRCRAALKPGGRLLVREGDPARRGGARFTRAVESVVTRLGWNRGPQVRFRDVAALRADLESLGFTVRIDEVAARTHPGNVLLVCEAAAT
jgi:uncharacterized protein (DUF2062 family)